MRYTLQGDRIVDSFTAAPADPADVVQRLNDWQRFQECIQDGSQPVDDVLADAGLCDD